MSPFVTLLRMELLGLIRRYRLLVLLVLFGLVGLASPLLAWGMPAMLQLIPEDQLAGVEILLTAEPTTGDALGQYLKNFGMLPVVVLVLATGGLHRTPAATWLLAKPVSRRAVLAARALVLTGAVLLATVVAGGACLLYTNIIFGPVDIPGFLLLHGLLLLFSIVMMCAGLLADHLLPGTGAAVGAGIGLWLFLNILVALPTIASFTPAGLMLVAGDLVAGRLPPSLLPPILGSCVFIALALFLADRRAAGQEIEA